MNGRGERGRPAREEAETVYGVHPVSELLASRAGDVERVWVSREAGARVGRVLRVARTLGVPVSYLTREALERRVGRAASHQGLAATVAAARYADLDGVYRSAEAQRDALLLLVDRVVDAGNLGALIRTAAAAGCLGVVLSTEGTAGLNGAVHKASAGAVERIPVARDPGMPRSVERLRAAGFLAIALDPRGDEDWDRGWPPGRLIVVAGGEDRGARPGVLRVCDRRVRIPLAPGIDSLNVAVATGVLLFEAVRRRRAGGRPGS